MYGRVQTIMFILLILGLVSFIVFGMPYVSLSNIGSSFSLDFSLIAKASSLMVKNPEKTLPKGVLLSISATAIIYILVALITYGFMSSSFYASYDFANGSIADMCLLISCRYL